GADQGRGHGRPLPCPGGAHLRHRNRVDPGWRGAGKRRDFSAGGGAVSERRKLGTADYPLAEKRPDLVRTRKGRPLAALTLAALEAGEVALEDLRITPQALRQQAEIATAAGRPTLGRNFDRAAELIDVPQDVILSIYELLRPGRAKGKADLLD